MKTKEVIKKAGKFIWEHKWQIATGVCVTILNIVMTSAFKTYKMTGWADFNVNSIDPDELKNYASYMVNNDTIRITDLAVYYKVKDRLNLFERLNARKVIETAFEEFAEMAP